MKILSPRQRTIVNLLAQKGDVRVEEIEQNLNISKATAYREIQWLSSQGYAAKTPGGLSRMTAAPGNCLQCGRESNPRAAFLAERKDGSQFSACCPHCGLMALTHRTDILSAMTTDFFYGTLLNAAHAWYVLNSRISPCCQPSVLSFASLSDAQGLVQGFGGELANFTDALEKIKTLTQL